MDARARRTATALQSALLKLLENKSLEDITVREIAATAGINYATFFRHHASKDALLDHLASDEINHLVELTLPILDTLDARAAIGAIFAYIDENRTMWKVLLTGGAAGIMRDELLRLSRMSAEVRGRGEGWLPVELGVRCTVNLIFETLVWWMEQPPDQYSVAKATDILSRLIGMHGLIPDRQ